MENKKFSSKNIIGTLVNNPGFMPVLSSIISVVIGLLLGLIVLVVLNPAYSLSGFWSLLSTGFSSSDKLGKVIYTAAPLMMTGLAVGFAFKTGLFNIGASGQYLMGGFVALFAAIILKLPWYLDIILAMLAGAIWGAIPGIFKAYLNVNEVITAIMFNWIGLFIVNLIVANTPKILSNHYGGYDNSRTANIVQVNPNGLIPKCGLDSMSAYMNIGIFIAIFFAIITYIILCKTTFGYELKACGYNKNASKYAGINEKRNIILAMAISGALAGVGGALAYLAGTTNYQITKTLQAAGFNGIPIALLANNHPLGTIVTSFFISYINIGGDAMQPDFAKENIDVIISVIIYLSAFSLIMQNLIIKVMRKRKEKKALATGAKAKEGT